MAIPDTFKSYNEQLIHKRLIINLRQYIEQSQDIEPCANACISKLVNFISSADHDAPLEFSIPFFAVENFGFECTNTTRNRIRRLFRRPPNLLEDELALAKRYKLKPDIDYVLHHCRVSGFENVATGYRININAFYKMIEIRYGRQLLSAVCARAFKLMLQYDQYVCMCYTLRIEDLQQTINGLTEDITKLVVRQSDLSRSMLINYIDSPQLPDHRQSTFLTPISNSLHSASSRESDVDLRERILYLINSPSESISDMYYGVNTSISSHWGEGDIADPEHVDLLRERFSACLRAEPREISATDLSFVRYSVI